MLTVIYEPDNETQPSQDENTTSEEQPKSIKEFFNRNWKKFLCLLFLCLVAFYLSKVQKEPATIDYCLLYSLFFLRWFTTPVIAKRII